MKGTLIFSIATLLLAAAMLSQSADDLRGVRSDMMGALTGDIERFERGMRTVEALLEKNPKDPAILVLHGNGMMFRAGEGFRKGDMANAAKAWQSGLDEMAQAVELAPEKSSSPGSSRSLHAHGLEADAAPDGKAAAGARSR